jgi:hypothetical protein
MIYITVENQKNCSVETKKVGATDFDKAVFAQAPLATSQSHPMLVCCRFSLKSQKFSILTFS